MEFAGPLLLQKVTRWDVTATSTITNNFQLLECQISVFLNHVLA